MSALRFSGVRHAYGSRVVLPDLSFEVAPGSILALLGPSGSGKSTALRIAAGLEVPQAGEVRVGGKLVNAPGIFVPPERRDLGLLFQDLALFPHLDVAANVAFGLRQKGQARDQRVTELLALVGLEGLGRRFPHQLSGGQQQRVALARALAPGPGVLLLDEPFSNLDVVLRRQVRQEMIALLKKVGTAVLFVTHDPEEALYVADRVAVMTAGRIEQEGAPADLYLAPASRFVAAMFGETFVLPAMVRAGRAETALGTLEAPSLPDGAADVIVRASGLRLSQGGEAKAVVRAARILGATILVELDPLPGSGLAASLVARTPIGEAPAAGTRVSLALDPRMAFAFPREA